MKKDIKIKVTESQEHCYLIPMPSSQAFYSFRDSVLFDIPFEEIINYNDEKLGLYNSLDRLKCIWSVTQMWAFVRVYMASF